MELEVIKKREERLGLTHPHTLEAKLNYAVTLANLQKYKEAELKIRDVIRIAKKGKGCCDVLNRAEKALFLLLRIPK